MIVKNMLGSKLGRHWIIRLGSFNAIKNRNKFLVVCFSLFFVLVLQGLVTERYGWNKESQLSYDIICVDKIT
jgi:hypothetical protein